MTKLFKTHFREETEAVQNPLGTPNGHAKVTSYISGKTVNYEISKNDTKDKIKIRFKQVEENVNTGGTIVK